MKTDKCEIYASAQATGNGTMIRLHLATVYSKGLAYIVADHLAKTTYARTADKITVEIRQRVEYPMFTEKAKEIMKP